MYVRGLVQDGGRRTAAEMARRLPDGDEQALQQFVEQSPWAHEPVRKELALKMVGMLSPRVGWVVDDTGFPKKGKYSVGVARQYSGTLGKIGNCQVGVSLNYTTDDACVPLDFGLYLPKEWTENRERCRKAGVGEDVTFNTKQTFTWREGTKGPMTGRFACLRVQPSHGWAEGKVDHPVVWLLVEWPPEAESPAKFWLSNLGIDTTLPELIRLAKTRWWVEQNYQQMKEELGLDHYEGRSWRGWHHHVTLTMMAFCFLVAEALFRKKNLWVWEGLPITDDTPSA